MAASAYATSPVGITVNLMPPLAQPSQTSPTGSFPPGAGLKARCPQVGLRAEAGPGAGPHPALLWGLCSALDRSPALGAAFLLRHRDPWAAFLGAGPPPQSSS